MASQQKGEMMSEYGNLDPELIAVLQQREYACKYADLMMGQKGEMMDEVMARTKNDGVPGTFAEGVVGDKIIIRANT